MVQSPHGISIQSGMEECRVERRRALSSLVQPCGQNTSDKSEAPCVKFKILTDPSINPARLVPQAQNPEKKKKIDILFVKNDISLFTDITLAVGSGPQNAIN